MNRTIFLDKCINRYTVTCLLFLLWIAVLDSKYSWIKQYKLTTELNKMEESEEMYKVKLAEAKIIYEDLMSNKEKYAREKYFISKKGEDVFIVND
ncbi:MAG: cell division protein DivIC [Saprospiraceae bacterium]|jgi:cell division protein DivIC